MEAIAWLLDSDPAIRWQAMRDLTDAPAAEIVAVRARIPHEGVGARILASQQADGTWRRDGDPVWLTTLFTMQMLRASGPDPGDPLVQAAAAQLERGVRWNNLDGCWELRPPETGGNTFFEGEEEPCINGGALAVGAYFGRPQERLLRRLLAEQLEDGGWNCEAPKSRRSSFHTTICVLEGLVEYERAAGRTPETTAAIRRAQEYLLERRLFRRLSTGEVVDAEFLRFAFPPRYRYDVLRALDCLRGAGAAWDPRLDEALVLVESKRQADGRWLLEASYDETPEGVFRGSVGAPSRWNTLRALRVLRWFARQAPANDRAVEARG